MPSAGECNLSHVCCNQEAVGQLPGKTKLNFPNSVLHLEEALSLGSVSASRRLRKTLSVFSSLLFWPWLPIWFLALDGHALPLTGKI